MSVIFASCAIVTLQWRRNKAYLLKPKFHLACYVTSRHDTLLNPCILA